MLLEEQTYQNVSNSLLQAIIGVSALTAAIVIYGIKEIDSQTEEGRKKDFFKFAVFSFGIAFLALLLPFLPIWLRMVDQKITLLLGSYSIILMIASFLTILSLSLKIIIYNIGYTNDMKKFQRGSFSLRGSWNQNIVPIFLVLSSLIIFFIFALPYLQNDDSIHKSTVHLKPLTYIESPDSRYPFAIEFKFESKDAFISGKPIDVEINTIDTKLIENVQVIFLGAENFLGDYRGIPLAKKIERLSENIVNLDKRVTNAEVKDSNGNIVMEEIASFSGKKSGLVYNGTGNFEAIVSVSTKNEQDSFDQTISDVIYVSPPEREFEIKSNNLTLGVSWVAVVIAMLIPGLQTLLSRATESKN